MCERPLNKKSLLKKDGLSTINVAVCLMYVQICRSLEKVPTKACGIMTFEIYIYIYVYMCERPLNKKSLLKKDGLSTIYVPMHVCSMQQFYQQKA